MFQENELVALVLYGMTVVFVMLNRFRIRDLLYAKILYAAFFIGFTSVIFTNLEVVIWGTILNWMEHACYFASTLLIFIWCVLVFRKPKAKSDSY